MAVRDEKQKHYHGKDLKPIKSLDAITTNPIADDGKQRQQEALGEQQHQQDERYNSILMNDDCKLQQKQQQQDEQTSSSSDGTCRDKYCKNSKDTKQMEEMLSRRNDLKINEISTNNSTFNNIMASGGGGDVGSKINSHRNNLNLDLYFDKELSVWSSMMRKRALDSFNENEIQMRSSNADFESNSCVKLDNETMANYCNNDTASNSSDSTSSTTSTDSNLSSHLIGSSTHHETTNSNTPIPCRCDNKCDDDDDNSIRSSASRGHLRRKNRMRLFTDGTYVYGPYDFDLFTNSFYQFGEGNEVDDDKATFLQHHDENRDRQNRNITELLKNHDDINTSATTTHSDCWAVVVRDMKLTDVHEEKTMSNNDISPNDGVIINVTNCSDDERDLVEWKDDKNFNYLPASKEACDSHNLIDLIDEGGSYVSKFREKDVYVHDLHVTTPHMMSFNADFIHNVPLMQTAITVDAIDLNNSEQFNYERDKIVEITHDDDDNIPVTMRINRDEHEYLSTFASHAQCKSGAAVVNEKKNSNQDAPKINIDSGTDNIYEERDDVSNKIRFRECEQQKLCEMCGKFRSSVNDNCRWSDKTRDECQG